MNTFKTVEFGDDRSLVLDMNGDDLLFRKSDVERLSVYEQSGRGFHLMNIMDNRYLSLLGSFDDSDKGRIDGLKMRDELNMKSTRYNRYILIHESHLHRMIDCSEKVETETPRIVMPEKPARARKMASPSM